MTAPARRSIPFKEKYGSIDVRDALLSGRKTATTRSEAYAEWHCIHNVARLSIPLRLLEVTHMELRFVAEECYGAEGFDTPSGFISTWIDIHPRRGYVPTDKRYYHRFEVVR